MRGVPCIPRAGGRQSPPITATPERDRRCVPAGGGQRDPGDRPHPGASPPHGASPRFHGDRLLFRSPHFCCRFPSSGAAAASDPGTAVGLRAEVSRGAAGGGPCHAMPGRASPSAAVGAFFRHPEEKPEPRPPRSLFPLWPCRRPTHRCGVAGLWGYGVIGWVIGVTEPLRSLQTSFSGSGCSKLGATSCPTKPG